MQLALLEELLVKAFVLASLLSAVPLVLLLLVGLTASVFQAATQVQEQSVSFVPKIIALGLLLFVLGPWCVRSMSGYLAVSLDELATAEARSVPSKS